MQAIESYEHWGLGVAPIFSFPVSSQLKEITDTGLGTRIFYRKNMRAYGVEVGVEPIDWAGIKTSFLNTYVLGIYRISYMDKMDYSFGFGGGFKSVSNLDELRKDIASKNSVWMPFIRFRGMLELDLSSQSTMSFMSEYEVAKSECTENLRTILFSVGYTYYFGFYNFGN